MDTSSEEPMMASTPMKKWIMYHLNKGDIPGLELVKEPDYPPWTFIFPWVRMGDPGWKEKWSVIFAYVKHKDPTKIPSKEQWNNESSSKQIRQLKNNFRNAIDSRKKDFQKLNHNFGDNFRCYRVLDKNSQYVNYSLNVDGFASRKRRSHEIPNQSDHERQSTSDYNYVSGCSYQNRNAKVQVLQDPPNIINEAYETQVVQHHTPIAETNNIDTRPKFFTDEAPCINFNQQTSFLQQLYDEDIYLNQQNIQTTPIEMDTSNGGSNQSCASNESLGIPEGLPSLPETSLAQVCDNQKATSNRKTSSQRKPCSIRPSSSKLYNNSNLPGNSTASISGNKHNYEKDVLNLPNETLSRFQITVSYGGIVESTFNADLERGLQINLHKNFNESIKKHDAVMRDLIEEVGTNVKVIAYSGSSDKVTRIIRNAKGGIVLKFKKKQLKAFRLCQHKVFFSRFGGKDPKKIERCCEQNGRQRAIVFCYHKYVSGLKSGHDHDFATTIKFGTYDLVKIELKPICLIETSENTYSEEENFQSEKSEALNSVDRDLMESLGKISLEN